MDVRLVRPPRRHRAPLLHGGKPTRRATREQHGPRSAEHRNPPSGHERRIPPLRTQLLSALPPGSPDAATHRHIHLTPGIPLHRSQGTGLLLNRPDPLVIMKPFVVGGFGPPAG